MLETIPDFDRSIVHIGLFEQAQVVIVNPKKVFSLADFLVILIPDDRLLFLAGQESFF